MHLENGRTNLLVPEIKLEEGTPEDISIAVDLQIEQDLHIVKEPKNLINLETSITCECDYCDLQFLCAGLKEIHSAQNHAQFKSYSCELCTATFDTKEDYSKHEILHMNFEDPLTCPNCNQLQIDKIHLGLHLNQPCELLHIEHDEEKVLGTLECDTCGKIFDSLTMFKAHIEIHRKKRIYAREKESMQCDICQHVYKGYSNFLKHIRSHFYTFKCHFCDRVYKCKSQRTKHEHFHRNEQHLCIMCGANFPVRPRLIAHIREKHGDPNIRYKCPLCPLEFTQKHNLKRHSKTHTATRRFECNECPKKFFNAQTLKQHAILHTGLKRFPCKYCGVGFSQSAGRRGHEKRVHENNLLK